MIQVTQRWFKKYLSHPEAVLMLCLLLGGFALINYLGDILFPIMAAIIIAYLLESWVIFLEKLFPRIYAVSIVFIMFVGILLLAILVLCPLLWHQLSNLFNDLPSLVKKAEAAILKIADVHSNYISKEQVSDMIQSFVPDINAVKKWGKVAVSLSVSTIPGVITILVYLIIVPILILFFLKDKVQILTAFLGLLPKKRPMLNKVWLEVDKQIGNYVRGKVVEMLIVSIATYIPFLYFGIKYGVLLAFLVGLSVFIPYVGSAIVTVPVAMVAYLQWGFNSEFTYLMIFYIVIQALDGNVLVPLLFSEAVALHPVIIILTVLFFGSIWGFWGVFFAIPLAALFKSVFKALRTL